ncbi:GPCR fungal pheromone mating factor [Vararia minispora EC-137]|uniref:GPCR fungal pheromone mating factor n=1 Tax=Vararia minispora EC-137 TaxID=1314806 RepID=A0ACB8Q8H3_9AGAM|nr:GPCR fungal pheromone mating factor [Vararia minispora EC-137]
MQALLPVFSFLSILLLVLIIPGQLKSNTIPAMSIICWLFVCNIIHTANSIAWADNTNTHAPIWCDISTKILLGAMVAVPGSLLCLSRQLELVSSRYEHTKMPSPRYKAIVEFIMCIAIPFLYMSLHTIVQFRRFSVLENLGCQAAVHDSIPGLVLVWLPPFVISAVAFLYNCSAVVNITKSHLNSVAYFPSAPEMQLSLFIRRLVFLTVAVLYTGVAYTVILSWSSTNLLPWTSIAQVHAGFGQVEIIQSRTQLAVQSNLIWWSIPTWSLLLFALSVFGEETKKGYRKIWAWILGRSCQFTLPTRCVLPSRPFPALAHKSHAGLRVRG